MIKSKVFAAALAGLIALVVLVAAGSGISGCGGGGSSTGSSSTGTISGATFAVNWPAVTRNYDISLTSARSATITLVGGGAAGADYKFDIDRDATQLGAYTKNYSIPTAISTTQTSMTATFYSQTGSTGVVVGTATAAATLSGTSLTFTPISLTGIIKSVAVVTSNVTVGTSKNQIAAVAYDAAKNSVAVSPGSFNYQVTSGSTFLTLTTDGLATGVAAGVASVTATVDGITSPAASITVAVARPPTANPPVCGSAVRQLQGGSGTLNLGPNIVIPPSSDPRISLTPGRFRTFSYYVRRDRSPLGGTYPQGHSPAEVLAQYGVPPNAGSGAIAITVAGDCPTALADFNTFSTQFGLPTEPSSSSTNSGNSHLQIVYASGTKPQIAEGWTLEAALDVQWAHAMAPNAKIYLVEAPDDTSLISAVKAAKTLPNVHQISMSWGAAEDACTMVDEDPIFVQAGIAFFGGSGDSAGLRFYPSLSSNVISVGATSWSGGNSESVWSSNGCGPSTLEPRPISQDGVYSIVGLYRAAPDICVVGDPMTGVSVYCSYPQDGTDGATGTGWFVSGGTSASCPIFAGMVNASGVTYSGSAELASNLYSNLGMSPFYDVTTGSSAFAADTGFDLATGLGTPRGMAGLFHSGSATGTVSARRKL